MKQEDKDKLIDAIQKHAEDSLNKKGVSKTAITVIVLLLAALASWFGFTACTNTTIKNATIQHDLIITQPIENTAKPAKQ